MELATNAGLVRLRCDSESAEVNTTHTFLASAIALDGHRISRMLLNPVDKTIRMGTKIPTRNNSNPSVLSGKQAVACRGRSESGYYTRS
jgi:hypothetical protein